MANVLLVDDSRDVVETFALALELEGHTVHCAYDGAEGLREATQFAPHVAILDIGLPKVDGIELARALRQMHGAQLTIIACTGADDHTLRRVIDAGFDHVFRKPTKIQALLDVVGSCGAKS